MRQRARAEKILRSNLNSSTYVASSRERFVWEPMKIVQPLRTKNDFPIAHRPSPTLTISRVKHSDTNTGADTLSYASIWNPKLEARAPFLIPASMREIVSVPSPIALKQPHAKAKEEPPATLLSASIHLI